jgi:hypothetical protein
LLFLDFQNDNFRRLQPIAGGKVPQPRCGAAGKGQRRRFVNHEKTATALICCIVSEINFSGNNESDRF